MGKMCRSGSKQDWCWVPCACSFLEAELQGEETQTQVGKFGKPKFSFNNLSRMDRPQGNTKVNRLEPKSQPEKNHCHVAWFCISLTGWWLCPVPQNLPCYHPPTPSSNGSFGGCPQEGSVPHIASNFSCIQMNVDGQIEKGRHWTFQTKTWS